MPHSLWPHELQPTRLPCSSPFPRVCSHSGPLSWWCHLIISSSSTPFSFYLQSFPASGYFPMSRFFASGGRSIAASASVLPANIQGWFPLRLTGLISLLPKGLSGVFTCTTVWKHQFLWAFHNHGIIQYVAFCVWFLSFHMIFLSFIHVMVWHGKINFNNF